MSKSIGDMVFGSLYVFPLLMTIFIIPFLIYGFLIDNQRIISDALLLLGLTLILPLLKRAFSNTDSFNYKKYGLKDEKHLKSICNSWLTDEERNDPDFDICKCGQDRLVHGTKYCNCANFQFAETFSKRFEQ